MKIISDVKWYLWTLAFLFGMMVLLLETKSFWFIVGLCAIIISLQKLHKIEAH
jgi:hypothetical protein